jgi:dolichol-phosphate mannosyltransferase
MTDTVPELSVVVPLYNEEENIPELYRRLSAALGQLGLNYQLVLVNDGSRDRTPALLTELHAADSHVAVLHLSRNFGHQAAVSAGLAHAPGRAVAVMDGDLQDPPEVLGAFLDKWREGYDVVYAVRQNRKEGALKRAGYWVFYRLLRAISDLDIPLDSGDFCLMDRKVVAVLNHLPERMRFVRGLRTFVGFRQTGLCYDRAARYVHGRHPAAEPRGHRRIPPPHLHRNQAAAAVHRRSFPGAPARRGGAVRLPAGGQFPIPHPVSLRCRPDSRRR